MAMEGVRSSLAALLLFLTLLVLAANASGDDGAAAVKKKKQCYRPLAADEPYALLAFHNNADEEIRLLADQTSSRLLLPGVSAFANRSGHWFYSGIQEGKPIPRPQPNKRSRTPEGFWNTLGVLVNTTTASGGGDLPASGDDEGYVLIGLQTGGGDKIRLVVVADKSYFFITGHAQGWFLPPNWFFLDDGERHRLLPVLSNGSSHAEVVASNVLAAMMKRGKAFCG